MCTKARSGALPSTCLSYIWRNEISKRTYACADQQAYRKELERVDWRVGLASRAVAVIQFWMLPLKSSEAAVSAAFAVSCLEHGVLWSHPELLIQAASTLKRPDVQANMCALPRG